jgi:hypothetical protein
MIDPVRSGRLKRWLGIGTAIAVLAGASAGLARRQSPLTIPAQRASNVFFVRTSVNGVGPMWFSLDTGANLTVLDPAAAHSAGLAVSDEGARPGVGSGTGLTQLGRTQGAILQVGRVGAFSPRTLFVVPVRAMSGALGHQIDGVLGVDFMRRYLVEFDYPAGAVRFHESSSFVYGGSGQILPIDLTNNILTVRAPLRLADGEETVVRWLIDTGRTGRPMLNAPFVKRHRLVERFAHPGHLAMSQGVNGLMQSRTAKLGAIRLGGILIDQPVVDLSEATEGLTATDDYDGHLGALLLSGFRMLIDFPGRRIILEREPTHSHANTY